MMQKTLLLSFALFGASAAPPAATILIVADDLGFNEMGFNNASRGLLTPHLDALAAGGVKLTSYYTHPLCSPTRSALMTGRYSHRLGTQSSVIYWDTPWSVPIEEKFMPQYLKDIPGFGSTAMFGKSHMGMHAKAYWPSSRGFDTYAGYLQGCGSQDTHVASCCSAPANASDFVDFVCPSAGPKDYRGRDWWNDLEDASADANHTSSSELIAALAEGAIANYTKSGLPFFL